MYIKEYLNERALLADGAFSTYYYQREERPEKLAELANLSHPEAVKAVHKAYLEAGARLIRTNTFAAGRAQLQMTKAEQKQLLKAGYQLACDAVDGMQLAAEDQAFVAADIGPVTGEVFSTKEDLEQEYREIADVFLECGAEVFLFETFSGISEVACTARYIKEQKKDAFVIASFCLNRYGYTRSGVSSARILTAFGEDSHVDCVGFNCGIGSGHLLGILGRAELPEGKYLTAMPNASYPQMLADRTVFMDNTDYFAENLAEIRKMGVHIIGGCCGTNPEYIEKAFGKADLSISEREPLKKPDKEAVNKAVPRENAFMKNFEEGKKVIAVELDPPYDAKVDRIMECANLIKSQPVDILTFADSPMGRGRVDSLLMGVKVAGEVGMKVMPHVACRDKNVIGMRAGILGAYINGIRNLLIVTGDPVPGSECTGVFDFNSIKLMEFIQEMNQEHFAEDPICYGAALNYGRGNLDKIIARCQRKIDAGASYFLTQPVFTEEGIERITYIKEHLDTKILCGIMPLVSYRNARFIRNEVTGIEVPETVLNRFSPDMSRAEGEETGVAVAGEIMDKLGDAADGFYLMLPFNRVSLVEKLLGE